MAISKLKIYNREQTFYEKELSKVIESLNNNEEELIKQAAINKKEAKPFIIKYNGCATFLGLLSVISENMMPGLMVIMFGIYNILDTEVNNLERIKCFEDNLNKKEMKKLYLQGKIFLIEQMKKGTLKFELKDGKMVLNTLSDKEYYSYLESEYLLDEPLFLPDYYKNKKINIKTLQKQIKAK